jgi:hypothetical protein
VYKRQLLLGLQCRRPAPILLPRLLRHQLAQRLPVGSQWLQLLLRA